MNCFSFCFCFEKNTYVISSLKSLDSYGGFKNFHFFVNYPKVGFLFYLIAGTRLRNDIRPVSKTSMIVLDTWIELKVQTISETQPYVATGG